MVSYPFHDGRFAGRLAAATLGLALVHAGWVPDAGAQRGNGRVAAAVTISPTTGGFTGTVGPGELFGQSIARLGDLDGDGVTELAVGSTECGALRGCEDDEPPGAVWILFLNPDGSVKGQQRIAAGEGGFTGALDPGDFFGYAVAGLGDLDGDGVPELAVGAIGDDDVFEDAGAVWILFLETDGTVKAQQKIGNWSGGFWTLLPEDVYFGNALSGIGDHDGDGIPDLAAAAAWYPSGLGGGPYWRGAVWVLLLNANGTVKAQTEIAENFGGFTGVLHDYDLFGHGVASIGDLDGDGVGDLAVASQHDPDGGPFTGAVWTLFLHADGTVKSHQKISQTSGNFSGVIHRDNHFGTSVAAGDVDGDGATDVLVGQYTSDDPDTGSDTGAVWLLLLRPDGTVRAHQKVRQGLGGFAGPLGHGDSFGWAAADLGDLDGDGIADWAVGGWRQTVWILFGDGAPAALCGTAPLGGCAPATGARLRIADHASNDDRSRLVWSWRTRAAVFSDLGDPTTVTDYALCIWDTAGGTPVHAGSIVVPPGANWTMPSSQKRRYKDPANSADGVTALKLTATARGAERVALRARRRGLPLPVGVSDGAFFTQDPSVTVQLVNDEGACWTSTFTAARRSELLRFTASVP